VLEFEGLTDDGAVMQVYVVDPTVDRQMLIQDEDGFFEGRAKGTTALTDATATSFAQIAIGQTIGSNFTAGIVVFTIYCADATNQVVEVGQVEYACHNIAGTETCTFSTSEETSHGDGTASLVAPAWTITAGTDTIDLEVDSDCAGVTPTTHDMYWEIDQQSYSEITPQS
jgi:hypothetical protein